VYKRSFFIAAMRKQEHFCRTFRLEYMTVMFEKKLPVKNIFAGYFVRTA